MLSLNTNIYASESMDSNEYSIIETFSDGSYIKSVLIDDSTDCSSLARKTSTKTGRRVCKQLETFKEKSIYIWLIS